MKKINDFVHLFLGTSEEDVAEQQHIQQLQQLQQQQLQQQQQRERQQQQQQQQQRHQQEQEQEQEQEHEQEHEQHQQSQPNNNNNKLEAARKLMEYICKGFVKKSDQAYINKLVDIWHNDGGKPFMFLFIQFRLLLYIYMITTLIYLHHSPM